MKAESIVAAGLLMVARLASAAPSDPAAELGAFSIFDKIDVAQLANSDVKTAHGAPMSNGRFLSVQSCYVQAGTPAQHLEALRSWNPAPHRELDILLHVDISGAPSEAAFAKIKSAPDNGAVRAFAAATSKMAPELQLSREEAAKFSAGGDAKLSGAAGDFWSQVLAGRARQFVSGGTSALAPYDHTGTAIRAGDELNGLLREQSKIRKQFGGLLDSTGIGRGAGSLKADLYWELLDVEDVAVATLGAFYSRNSGDSIQAAETFYYASGGYYAGLTLYQMWLVNVNGRPSTLVWRGDMISSARLGSLHGVEKLASESAMMKDVGRAITLFRKDTSR